jgi:tripartite-type tricarboxylate transporter receptor subunit TctC
MIRISNRISFSAIAASALIASFLLTEPRTAHAQDSYPNKSVTLVLPWSPGAIVDNVGRRFAQQLTDTWKQTVIVKNEAGGGGNIGAASVARAAGDGYTLMLTLHDGLIIAKATQANIGFDPSTDLAPIGLIGKSVTVVAVKTDSPFTSVEQLIQYAKANPGKLNFGGNGIATSYHLALENLNLLAGSSITHVPYKGGAPAMVDLIAGRIDFMFSSVSLARAQLDAGKIKVIGIANAQRSNLFPGIPTIAESGFLGFEVPTGIGVALYAPGTTPAAIIQKINTDLMKIVAEPKFNAWLISVGIAPEQLSAKQYQEQTAQEISKIEKIVKTSNIKLN